MSNIESEYQVMPEMDEEKFEALKRDIEKHGVDYPILVNEEFDSTENPFKGVIDGHHRLRAWLELGRPIEDIPKRLVIDSEHDNIHRAYRLNLLSRDLNDGEKREIVKQYLMENPDRIESDTQREIAEDLGVSHPTVSRTIKELSESVKFVQLNKLDSSEKKERVREYFEENPDASTREAARELDFDISRTTISKILREIKEDDTEALKIEVQNTNEIKKTKEIKEKAETGDETAQKEWNKLQHGETSINTAAKNVEMAEAEAKVAEQETINSKYPPVIRQQDAVEFLSQVEPDLVVTDPPYSTDLEDVSAFAQEWVPVMLDSIGDKGRAFVFIGAYPVELKAYLDVLTDTGAIDRTQVLVWTYKNTLGQTPKKQYKQNWQAILFIQSITPIELDSPLTSEQWAVQEVNAPDARTGERYHQWEKPGSLIRRFIRHTTDEDDLVVDPFVGTGTTVLEATRIGRQALGVDNDEEMLRIAEERGCTFDD